MYDSIVENGKKLPKCRTYSVQFDSDTALILSGIAAACGRSSSFIIRGLVLSYLDEHPELTRDFVVDDNEDPEE